MARGQSVREMLATTDAAELTEAMAYARIEPWGERHADWRTAMVCLTVYRMLAGKGSPNLNLKDFMPNLEPKHELTPEEFVAKLFGMTAAAAGGTING